MFNLNSSGVLSYRLIYSHDNKDTEEMARLLLLLTPKHSLIGFEWLTETHVVKSGQSVLNMAITISEISGSQMKQFVIKS